MMSRNRKAGGTTQTHNDQKGDRGRRADRGKASDHAAKEPEEKKRCTSPTQTNEKRGSEWYDLAHKDQQSEQRVLADEAKKQLQILRNPPGRSRKYYEVKQFLYLMYKLLEMHQSGKLATFAAHKVGADFRMYSVFAALLLGLGKDNARDASRQYWEDGTVLVDETPRGRASPNYVLDDARKLQPQHLARIESYIVRLLLVVSACSR